MALPLGEPYDGDSDHPGYRYVGPIALTVIGHNNLSGREEELFTPLVCDLYAYEDEDGERMGIMRNWRWEWDGKDFVCESGWLDLRNALNARFFPGRSVFFGSMQVRGVCMACCGAAQTPICSLCAEVGEHEDICVYDAYEDCPKCHGLGMLG